MLDIVSPPPRTVVSGFDEGTQRLVAHLRSQPIDLPLSALAPGNRNPHEAPYEALSPLEKALLDWFEYRDFEQAHALLHRRQATNDWHVLRPVAQYEQRLELSDPTLCPSELLALELLVRTCDQSAVRVERCWRRGPTLVVESAGRTLATVEPIRIEPFDRGARNRVRSAFRGVRERDFALIRRRAANLPGFAGLPWRGHEWQGRGRLGCTLFGFPKNWAFAMRGALRDAGVILTQSQALEAAAVYLGAGSWHELHQHDDEPFASPEPVGVKVCESTGQAQWSFYCTPEEALWATASQAGRSAAPLCIEHIDASFGSKHRVHAVLRDVSIGRSLDEGGPGIECASHDLWSSSGDAVGSTLRAAKLLLGQAATRENGGSVATLLYTGTTIVDLVLGIMERAGIPPTHLVIGDSRCCVVEHRERRSAVASDVQRHEAILRLYEIDNDDVRPSHVISMYKAVVVVEEIDRKAALVIRGDYGNDEPVTITFPTARRRQQLLDLTHADGMFSLVAGPTVP